MVDAPLGVAVPVGTGEEVAVPPGTDVVGDAVDDGCVVDVASGPWCGTGVEDPVEMTRPSDVPEVSLLDTGWPISASATLMVPMASTKTPTTTAVRRAKGLRPPHRRRGAARSGRLPGRCSGPWTTRARGEADDPVCGRSSRSRLPAVRSEWA